MVNYEDQQLNGIFAALSDPTRREMVSRLAGGRMSVTDLSSPFSISKPAISKHLKRLEEAGLLQRQIEGRVHYCELRTAPLAEVSKWIKFYEGFWNSKLDQLEAHFSNAEENH